MIVCAALSRPPAPASPRTPGTDPGHAYVVAPFPDGERRFVLRPGRVIALASLLVGGGAGVVAVVFAVVWLLAGPDRWKEERARLQLEVAELRHELAELRKAARAAPDVAQSSEGRSDQLRVRAPTDGEPTVRIAALHATDPVFVSADGLLVAVPGGRPVPIPPEGANLLGRGAGFSVDGDGAYPSGARLEGPSGTVQVRSGGTARTLPLPLVLSVRESRLTLVAELDVERYIAGVVSAELPAGWGIEAKKAQSVAARTYALMQRATATGDWQLEAAVEDQAWKDDGIDGTSRAAVTATLGEVLTKDGYVVSAFYHAACAGRTEVPPNVWPGRAWLGNTSVDCGFCDRSAYQKWGTEVDSNDLLAGAPPGLDATRVGGLSAVTTSDSERVTRVRVDTDKGPFELLGNDLRALLGWNRVRSAIFTVTPQGGRFRIAGRGAGHGVGLCQWGAQQQAQGGRDYREILQHYYPEARVEKIW